MGFQATQRPKIFLKRAEFSDNLRLIWPHKYARILQRVSKSLNENRYYGVIFSSISYQYFYYLVQAKSKKGKSLCQTVVNIAVDRIKKLNFFTEIHANRYRIIRLMLSLENAQENASIKENPEKQNGRKENQRTDIKQSLGQVIGSKSSNGINFQS